MGVDLNTYRCRIGTFTGNAGNDVITLCIYMDLSMTTKVIGCPICIGLLLLIAGIEPNPGPIWLEICYIIFVIYVIFLHFLDTKREEHLRAIEIAEARRKPSPPSKPYCSILPAMQVSWRQTPGEMKITGYEIQRKESEESKWTNFTKVNADKSYIDLTDVNLDNQYQFKVRTLYENRRTGPFSEPSNACTFKTSDSNLEDIIHLSKLITGKSQIRKHYQLPVIKDKDHTDERAKTRKCILGTGDMPSMHLEEKTILVVGDGDTNTFIDGLVNYLYGVKWNDNFRFHMTETAKALQKFDEWITSYTINPLPQSDRQNFTLTVITTGKVQSVSNRLRVFLLQYKIEIDAIYYVSRTCSPMELSRAIDAILFDTEQIVRTENRFVVLTTAEENTQSTIPEDGSPLIVGWLKFNTTSLFEYEMKCQNEFGKWYWTISMDSYKTMVSHLGQLSVQNSSLFDKTLKIREWAVTVMNEYWTKIQKCIETILSLEAEKVQIKNPELVDDKYFKYKIRQVRRNSLQPINELFCLFCGMSCHSQCTILNDKDIRNCSNMVGEFCSVCPEKCLWTVHKIRQHKSDYLAEIRETNVDDFRKRYRVSESMPLNKNVMLKFLEEKEVHLRTKLRIIIGKLCESSKVLQHTTIPLTPRHILMRMIKNEELNKKPNFDERLSLLRILVQLVMVIPESVPPSKPMPEKATHRTITLSWKTIPGALPLHFEVFQREKTEHDEWIKSDQIQKTSDNSTTVRNLKPSTKYHFKVAAVYLNQRNKKVRCLLSEVSDEIVTYSVEIHNVLSMSQVVGRNIYQLPVWGEKHQEVTGAMKFVGTGTLPSWKEDEETVLFFGDFRAHKDSVINGLVNYLYGVEWEDDFRLKLVDYSKSSLEATQIESIVGYTVRGLPESKRQKLTLTVIDTPGYDITNTQEANRLADTIQRFLKDNENIHSVDAACFVIPSSNKTQVNVPLIPGILKEQTFIFTTSTADQEPLADSTLKCFPDHDVFKVNTGSLLEIQEKPKSWHSKANWDMSMESYHNFISIISQHPMAKLDSSTRILDIRRRIIIITLGLRKEIDKELELLAMENRIDHIISNSVDSFSISFPVKKYYQKSMAVGDGKCVAFCLLCNSKCHYPCEIPENKDMQDCKAIDENHCTVCPRKCHWCMHKNINYNVEWDCEDEYINCEDRYGPLQTERLSKECIAVKIKEKRQDLSNHIQAFVAKFLDCCNYLGQISLNADPIRTEQLYELMILSEERERKLGYSDRIATLETLIPEVKKRTVDNSLPDLDLPKLFSPTQPRCTRAQAVGIDLSWKVVPYMKDPRLFEVWKCEFNTSEWIKNENDDDDNSTTVRITNLKPATKYQFKVRAIDQDEVGPFSESSDPITTYDSETTKTLLLSRLLQDKRLEAPQYCLPVFPDLQNNSDEKAKSVVGTGKLPSWKEDEKIILFFGDSKAHKDLVINGLVNYLYGVEWEDDFRLRLDDFSTSSIIYSRGDTQTEIIVSYSLHALPESKRQKFTLTVINTPGYDITNTQEANHMSEAIQHFLKDYENIYSVSAACFVIPSSNKSPVNVPLIPGILFKENTFIFITSTADQEQLADSTLKYVPHRDVFKVNTGSLLEIKDKAKGCNSKTNWDMSMESYSNFVSIISQHPMAKLDSSTRILDIRRRIIIITLGLRKKIDKELELLAMENRIDHIISNSADSFNISFSVKKYYQQSMAMGDRKCVTFCLMCNSKCHYPCEIPENEDIQDCKVIDKNRCTVCPGKCHWCMHKNINYNVEWHCEDEDINCEDRYGPLQTEKLSKECIVVKLKENRKTLSIHIQAFVAKVLDCCNYLRQLSHTAEPLLTKQFYELMIQSEKREKKLGYSDRIATLETLIQEAKESITDNTLPDSDLPRIFPPTKAKCIRATAVGIDVSWKVVPYVKDARFFEVWKREINTSEWIKNVNEEDDNSTTVRITNLKPATNYQFKVRAIYQDEVGPFSESSNPITTYDRETTKTLSLSRLLQGKRLAPTQYCLPEFLDLQNNSDEKTKSVVVGTQVLPPKDQNEKIVLIVGATSSGKTTLIEGLMNYLYGVKWEDDYRFRVEGSQSSKENESDNPRTSKTEIIKSYKILPLPNNERLKSPLTVIDTPGFDNSLETKDLIARIQNALPKDTESGGGIIDAVCFVMKSPINKLNENEKSMFKRVLSLLKQPVNVLGMETFASSTKLSTMKLLQNEEIKLSECFAFNNSSLFESNIKKELKGNWVMSMDSYKKLISCVMKGLERRLDLRIPDRPVMEGCGPSVSKLLSLLSVSRYILYAYIFVYLGEAVTAMEELNILNDIQDVFLIPGFGWSIKTIRKSETTIKDNATICTCCNVICHDQCGISENESRKECCVINKNGYCTECPLRCYWTNHEYSRTKRDWHTTIMDMPYRIIRKRYNIYRKEKIRISEMRRKNNERIWVFTHNLYFWLRLHYECDIYVQVNELKGTSTVYTPPTFRDYLSNKIKAEQTGPGYDERIKTLKLVQKTEEEMTKQNQYPTSNPEFIPSNVQEEERTILVLGETGSGKSTFIDGLLTYIQGVKWEESLWFNTTTSSGEPNKTMKAKATEKFTRFTVQTSPETTKSYLLNIIDTPGFSSYIHRQDQFPLRLRKFLLDEQGNGQHTIDAICIVMPSAEDKLTSSYKALLSLFGDDVKENIILISTFADERTSTHKEFPFHVSFEFNNIVQRHPSKKEWDISMESYGSFFAHLSEMLKCDLKLTLSVLETNCTISEIISEFRESTVKYLDLVERLKRMSHDLEEIEDDNRLTSAVLDTNHHKSEETIDEEMEHYIRPIVRPYFERKEQEMKLKDLILKMANLTKTFRRFSSYLSENTLVIDPLLAIDPIDRIIAEKDENEFQLHELKASIKRKM